MVLNNTCTCTCIQRIHPQQMLFQAKTLVFSPCSFSVIILSDLLLFRLVPWLVLKFQDSVIMTDFLLLVTAACVL